MIEVDARGLSCPIPVVKTKKAMESKPGDEIVVLVDEMTQVENISRLARSRGYSVAVEESEDGYRLTLTPPG